jgi:nucleoside-diphosphate-sugar epimerase
MLTVVVGTGYTGIRILRRITDSTAIGLSRSIPEASSDCRIELLNLDRDGDVSVELSEKYALIYTVPPAGELSKDTRLSRIFKQLSPAPRRFVYISTTGVYGNQDGELVNENTVPQPGSSRSGKRLAAEQRLQQRCEQQGIELVILRVPGIYGPGRVGLEAIRDGTPVLSEADAYPGNRIHVDDLVTCCINATAGETPPGIYNVGDGDFRTSTWFAHEVAHQAGQPKRPEVSRVQAEKEFSALRLSFLSESRRIDTNKMRTVLGVTLAFRTAENGISNSLE